MLAIQLEKNWKSEFYQKVWVIVREIPFGKVTTYGRIASMISPPSTISSRAYFVQAPRWVGTALSKCPEDVPWHRVINSKGEISYKKGGSYILQKEHLLQEGIQFDALGKIDLKSYGWQDY
jgi:methylated-DNA-protein-cysteine methyltransferase related protein